MPSFFDVLTAAVRDMTEHGFDSQARVDRWIAAIHEAALRSLTPPHILEQALRSTLATVYARQIGRGGILRYHPGVPAYTLRAVQPALRAELDRRIMASAELIRLNRASAIQSTLQRFAGWSSSIPAGGSRAVATPAVKTGIRRSLAQLPFIERRVAIDQGAKFAASLNATLAHGGNAIAARWVSHWKQAGYNYRPDHKERDDEVYAIRGNWALESGLMKAGAVGYTDEITQPAEEVFCRCFYIYIYHIRKLPDKMLTAKGRMILRQLAERTDAQVGVTL